MKARLLIVDDELILTKALSRYLNSEGYETVAANNGAEAIELLKGERFDVMLTDLNMPGMDGLELIKTAQTLSPHMATIIMTGFGSIGSAVEAMKAGAFHYVTKPFELDDIGLLIKKAIEHSNLKGENLILKKQVSDRYGFDNIKGVSDELKGVCQLVQKVSDTDSTVLILGESGTGKELIARAIHYNSNRADKPLVPVNCGAIPENLLESELFGHVKGAFTGAIQSRMGRFEIANGGTIFLDEIGDMSLRLQVKILRVLQERRFEAVGSTRTIEVDVRVITATHRNLEDLVRKGQFREDLFYRLNVIPIQIPPLRQRTNDIPLLAEHFLKTFAAHNKSAPPIIPDEIMSVLCNYQWPGNIRELENTIERLAVLKAG